MREGLRSNSCLLTGKDKRVNLVGKVRCIKEKLFRNSYGNNLESFLPGDADLVKKKSYGKRDKGQLNGQQLKESITLREGSGAAQNCVLVKTRHRSNVTGFAEKLLLQGLRDGQELLGFLNLRSRTVIKKMRVKDQTVKSVDLEAKKKYTLSTYDSCIVCHDVISELQEYRMRKKIKITGLEILNGNECVAEAHSDVNDLVETACFTEGSRVTKDLAHDKEFEDVEGEVKNDFIGTIVKSERNEQDQGERKDLSFEYKMEGFSNSDMRRCNVGFTDRGKCLEIVPVNPLHKLESVRASVKVGMDGLPSCYFNIGINDQIHGKRSRKCKSRNVRGRTKCYERLRSRVIAPGLSLIGTQSRVSNRKNKNRNNKRWKTCQLCEFGCSRKFSRNLFNVDESKLRRSKRIKSKEGLGNRCLHPREVMKRGKKETKQELLRLLLDAGWTVQQKPRPTSKYNHIIYLNPEGRAFWSITLAYRMLKKHHDDSGRNSGNYKARFKFASVPDGDMQMITKVISNARSDKNMRNALNQRVPDTRSNLTISKGKKLTDNFFKLESEQSRALNLTRKRRFANHSGSLNLTGIQKLTEPSDNKKDVSYGSFTDFYSHTYALCNSQRSVISWMIDLGTIPEKGNVRYLYGRKRKNVLQGMLTRSGICCHCCKKFFTLAEFAGHSGGKSCHPSAHIYLDAGVSLLQKQLDTWNKQCGHRGGHHFVNFSAEDPNDDICGICGEGGDLICCDACPSTFHQNCLGIKNFPSGIWHCPYCSCKVCGGARDIGSTQAFLSCGLCQEKFHKSCIGDELFPNVDSSSVSFCGRECFEIYEGLHMLVGVRQKLTDEISWSLVRRYEVGCRTDASEIPRKVECNSKVAVAFQIMDECFKPMIDSKSGVNLIRNIVYNVSSNLNRLDYRCFLTAVLEKGDEIVAAASIRIHGKQSAEIPFIGTRHGFRRQGMCQRLLTAIETALSSLKIEKLFIPAISELVETWTLVFGFEFVEQFGKSRMWNRNMVVFPGVDMLQKRLLKHQHSLEIS